MNFNSCFRYVHFSSFKRKFVNYFFFLQSSSRIQFYLQFKVHILMTDTFVLYESVVKVDDKGP